MTDYLVTTENYATSLKKLKVKGKRAKTTNSSIFRHNCIIYSNEFVKCQTVVCLA